MSGSGGFPLFLWTCLDGCEEYLVPPSPRLRRASRGRGMSAWHVLYMYACPDERKCFCGSRRGRDCRFAGERGKSPGRGSGESPDGVCHVGDAGDDVAGAAKPGEYRRSGGGQGEILQRRGCQADGTSDFTAGGGV